MHAQNMGEQECDRRNLFRQTHRKSVNAISMPDGEVHTVAQRGDSTDLHGNKTSMVGVEERELQDGMKDICMLIEIPPPT